MTPKAVIMVVEDEDDHRDIVAYSLGREGFQVLCRESGKDVVREVRDGRPDLVVLDIMLPDLDGLEICRIIKTLPETAHIPVILVTAKTSEADVVAGLECGADDYVTKPFSPRVLVARVRALLRARRSVMDSANGDLHFGDGDIIIRPLHHDILVSGKSVTLTATEFRILLTLARRPAWVFNREQLMLSVRGENTVLTRRSVDVHVVRLRNKLGQFGDRIETVRGLGYRFRG